MSKNTIEHALPTGTMLKNGMYTITSLIGAGGFGITYLGVKKSDTSFGESKKVVIKELFIAPNPENYNCIRDTNNKRTVRPSGSLGNNFDDFKRRFKEEAETLYRFREYEGMVQVLDYFEENNTFYFVMDYIESTDLLDVVKLKKKLSLDESMNYINQVGSLVHKIHQHKVLNRDIKPQNILIDKTGKAFLIDFGISKTYDNLDKVSKITGFHTAGYAPPEQFANKMNLISEAMDVHALAATFYFCITGHHPPTLQDRNLGADVSVCKHNPGLPTALDTIVERAMTIRPQDRTQTVNEFLDGLHNIWEATSGNKKIQKVAGLTIPETKPEKPGITKPEQSSDYLIMPGHEPKKSEMQNKVNKGKSLKFIWGIIAILFISVIIGYTYYEQYKLKTLYLFTDQHRHIDGRLGNDYRIVGKNNEVIVKPHQYADVVRIFKSYLAVQDKSTLKWGVIDSAGIQTTDHIYDNIIFPLDENSQKVEIIKGGKMGYLTKDFKEINLNINPDDFEGEIGDNLYLVFKVFDDGQKYGIVNQDNQKIVECIYDKIYSYSEGLARVERNDKYGFIDTYGKVVIPISRNAVDIGKQIIQETAAKMMNDQNKLREIKLNPPRYGGLFFKNGVVAVEEDGKERFIDKTNKYIDKK